MPQYTIKLHTYDPVIVDVFEQLRKNRKQAAFTHEALKHFIASGKASQMIALMSHEARSPLMKPATETKYLRTFKDDVLVEPATHQVTKFPRNKGDCEEVLKKILG